MSLDPSDRKKLIRLATSLPKGDEDRRQILSALKTAGPARYLRYSWAQYVTAMSGEYLGVLAEAAAKEIGYAGGKATPNTGNSPGRVSFTLKDDHGIMAFQSWPAGKGLDVNVRVDWQGHRVEVATKLKADQSPSDYIGKTLMAKLHREFKKAGADWPARKSSR